MPGEDIPSLASLRRRSRPTPQPSLFADPVPAPSAAERVFTVSQLVASLRALVERTHPSITVEGEISNWKPSASGHCYFTLKDANSQLPVVLFRADVARLGFRPKDGDAVRVRGRLSLYDPRGQLQLIASGMQPLGLGALLAAVQELKIRLRSEGLFERHRPLPVFPHCVGVITSLQGAALRDIVKVIRRRHSSANLVIYPVAVQGPNCPAEVVRALRWFAQNTTQADVLLLARGGGSFEDLHGFNAEIVVRALAASPIPTLSAIGHAIDSVLSDLAADHCAPTPSAAAELVTAGHFQLATRVDRLATSLCRAQQLTLLRAQRSVAYHSPELLRRRAQDNLNRLSQRADELDRHRNLALQHAITRRHQELDAIESRLERFNPQAVHIATVAHIDSLAVRLTRAVALTPRLTQLARAEHRLGALNPLSVLSRGYALVYIASEIASEIAPYPAAADTTEGRRRLVQTPADAPPGSTVIAQLAHGSLRAKVLP